MDLIRRGDTVKIEVTVTDSDGVVFDLTGYDMTFTTTGAAVIEKISDSGGGIEITSASGGEATITLDPADTTELGMYKFDIQVTDGTDVYTVVTSYFKIVDDVTK